jgi:hypothetical protein
MSVGGLAGVVIGHENFHERARPDVLHERVGFLAPRFRGPDHRVDGKTEALLSAIGSIIDILPSRATNNKDIQVIRRFTWPLLIPGCPGTKNQHLFCAAQPGKFLGHHLGRTPRQQQQLC